MGRSEGRSAEDTRRQILDAAADTVRARGIAATLDEIAEAAGVSKGGLIYHYRSKHALILALAEDVIEGFRSRVEEALDPADQSEGRLARAYITASFAERDEESDLAEHVALMTALSSDGGVRNAAAADADRWRRDLLDDGLPWPIVALVVTSTDGVSSVPSWASILDDHDADHLQRLLVAVTHDPGMLAEIALGDR